ncbi:hypothetical protein Hypma_010263 [Hypsizygus marmoreus]|uniref:RRM domain-containing protein n=1 Tax=Hypsizygus marmoreus TaxID=39966 RepID=A0A369JPY0_HYPMA|nr:hypothetical protein Hypma_010263 [Hypsizygus marmoreus]
MRFAWSSSELAAPSKAPRNARASSKRPSTSQHKRTGKLLAVQNARRREKARTGVAKPPVKHTSKVGEIFFVYVANLKPWITKDVLEKEFSHCGEIKQIIFRCSRGRAVTNGFPIAGGPLSPRDRQYATIEFRESKAAYLALSLNGVRIHGCQIVVTSVAADLPEVQDIIYSRLGTAYEQQGRVNPLKARAGKAKAIPLEKTQAEIDPQQSDRHRLFGFSFAKCVA